MNLLLTIILKATLVLLLSFFLLLLLRKKSASLRHWIISLSLIALLVLPFCKSYLPNLEVEITGSSEWLLTENRTQEIAVSENAITNRTEKSAVPYSKKADTALSGKIIKSEQRQIPYDSIWTIIQSIWVTGLCFFLGRFIIGISHLRQLTKKSRPFHGDGLKEISANVSVLVSQKIQTPMTWGFVRPIILLPETAQNWHSDTLKTVLQHEMAHIQRGDFIIHVLSLISVYLYWFHPFVWWMKKRQLEEREKACDEYVLVSGLPNKHYAEQLLNVARHLSTTDQLAVKYALPMAQMKALKGRILAIIAFQTSRFHFTKTRQFQWAGCYVSAILLFAAFTPVEPAEIIKMIDTNHPLSTYLMEETKSESSEKEYTIRPEVKPKVIPKTIVLTEKTDTLFSPQALAKTYPLPSLQVDLEAAVIELSKVKIIDIKTDSTKGIHGQWQGGKKGKNTFSVWTYGDFDFLPDYPYLEVTSTTGMIIIEEKRKTRKGIKTYLLCISKVPHDGGLVREFHNGKIFSWQGGYDYGDPVYFFTVDGEWRYYGKEKILWMADNMMDVWHMLSLAVHDKRVRWAEVDENNEMIKQQLEVKKQRLIPYGELPKNDFERDSSWGTWEISTPN